MENKYFIPDIEDIRVGYECEVNTSLISGISEGWFPYIFDNPAKIGYIDKYGIKVFRVPYLTKEQIEGEGWRNDCSFILLDVTDSQDLGNIMSTMFIKNEYMLIYSFESNKLVVKKNEEYVFQGKCKCINQFRTILKFINE